MNDLTIAYICCNGGEVFKKSLKSAKQLTDHILVVDSGSTDQSKTYAQEVGAQWVERPWPNSFSNQRNATQALVKTSWVLFLDTDEVLTQKLIVAIKKQLNDANESAIAFEIKRINFFLGKAQHYGSLSPDWVQRLYRVNDASWVGEVHERLVFKKETKLQKLPRHIEHYTYDSFKQWIDKAYRYTQSWAHDHRDKKSSFGKIALKTSFAFFRSYFIQLGFLDGKTGFVSSIMNAVYTFQKYAFLYDEQHKKK